jgi:hypothetical protein
VSADQGRFNWRVNNHSKSLVPKSDGRVSMYQRTIDEDRPIVCDDPELAGWARDGANQNDKKALAACVILAIASAHAPILVAPS